VDLRAALTVAEGLVFAEGPRWHDGALWFSDMHGGAVHRVGADGVVEVVCRPDDAPSGLGWLPDGSLLVVAMETQRLLRVGSGGGTRVHADLSSVARGSLNDMIVADDGTAYVGDMGARLFAEHPDHSVPGQIFAVAPDGGVRVACDGLRSPNGMVLPPGQATLVAAESGGFRLLRFARRSDGSLDAPTVFAELVPDDPEVRFSAPDGICGDERGAVWVADPIGSRVLRVLPGGEVTDVLASPHARPYACVLGGPDRRSLFVCVAETHGRPPPGAAPTGRVVVVDVEVAGAGRP
jgi:sugar lactone lactonase YvrE